MADIRILLVDGHSLANRAFYALPPLTTSKGIPTNALIGFLTMLFRFLEERKPTHIAITFDHPSPTFRHMEYEEYKANRKPSPDEFRQQIPLLKDILKALNIECVEVPGYEADDIIGTLVKQAVCQDCRVIILSGDKDCLQLVQEDVEAILPVRGISRVREYDSQAVYQDMGVWPEQIPGYKGLTGDSSDNIPGVPGVGNKTAVSLLAAYGNLESIYENLEDITPKRVQALLIAGKERAFMSRRLATINRDVPLKIDIQKFEWHGFDQEKAREIFSKYQFEGLLKRLPELSFLMKGQEENAQAGLVTQVPFEFEINMIESEDALVSMKDSIICSKQMSIYAGQTEVTKDFRWPGQIGISDGERCYLVRIDDQKLLWKYLGLLMVSGDVAKVAFDLKWVLTLCYKQGLTAKNTVFDVLVAAYLLDPTRTKYRFKDLIDKYLDEEKTPLFIDDFSQKDISYGKHLAAGAKYCFPLASIMKKELESCRLWNLAFQVEFPLVHVLAAMEASGVAVNLEEGRRLREEFGKELENLEKQVYELAGEKFALNSPKQLSHILFNKLGLKPVKKTKTGYSTDAGVLETLSIEHILPSKILEYRHFSKLKSTYLDVLEDVVNPVTGRIHSTFHQTVTATGRLSSSEPNLQNIPIRGSLGKSIRKVFVPAPGRLFLASDYSQIELRIMAHMAGDESMIEAFVKDEDIHTKTASEIFGVPVSDVTPELRGKAKAVNFGIIYGISDFGLARNTGVSRTEAKDFISRYFVKYPKVRLYMEKTVEEAKQKGYVKTIMGRRRPIPGINSRIWKERGNAERAAINTPIQGSAADIIKLAMVRIYRRLKDEGLISRLILQVHDELIFEIVPEEKEYMASLVREEMEGVMELRVPLKVDIDIGENWYEV